MSTQGQHQARLAVALSGGGHRATLWALGVLLYLRDVQLHQYVTSIASVSGGSLANAAVGHGIDYRTASEADFEQVLRRTARRAANGSVFAYWGTWAYLLLVLLVVPAASIFGPSRLPVAGWVELVIYVALVLAWSFLVTLRGRVTGRAFAQTLFGGTPRLSDLHTGVDHVLCATDLHAGEHVYFSGSFVAAYRFGLGVPGDLPLHRAAQASAAFPPVFPATWIATKTFGLQSPGQPEAAGTRALTLADGGVYDNMADQWVHGLPERAERWAALRPGFQEADDLLVANASAGLGWGPTWKLRIPFLGELLALLRDNSVLYDNGTSVRRHHLVAAFDLAAKTGSGLRGCLVHIEQTPFKAPDAFKNAGGEWSTRAQNAQAALTTLGDNAGTRNHWAEVARENAAVSTTLVGLGDEKAARLMHHAYVLAMVNAHVVLDYPLLALPPLKRFSDLLVG